MVLAAIATVVIGYGIRVIAFPDEIYLVRFERIGNLQIEDEVKVRGATVGKITDIVWLEDGVLVTFAAHTPLTIHKGYSIITTDKGTMGDRMMVIDEGSGDAPVVATKDTLAGVYRMGISEGLGKAWRLQELVRTLLDAVDGLLIGTEVNPSFVERFHEIIHEVDSLSTWLHTTAVTISGSLSTRVRALDDVASSAQELSRVLSGTVPEKITELDDLIGQISEFLERLDRIADSLFKTVAELETGNTEWGEKVDLLSRQLQNLRGLIDETRSDAMRLKIVLTRRKKARKTPAR